MLGKVNVGIDVSKKTLDVFFLSEKNKHIKVNNDIDGFIEINKLISDYNEVYVCLESSGVYTIPIMSPDKSTN